MSAPAIRVLVAIPCGDMVHAGFAFDLGRMLAYTVATNAEVSVAPAMRRGTLLPAQRDALVRDALAGDYTHILWLDADMRFPKELLLDLLAHHQPVVSTAYASRRQPVRPIAKRLDGSLFYLAPDATGLQQALFTGLGACLMQLEVFQNVPAPWFAVGYHAPTGEYAGEDVFLFEKLRQAGYTVWVDAGVSQHIGHAGELVFTNAHADSIREVIARADADTDHH